MSTIVAQTLSNGSVSTSTANCITGSAKAWVNFNGVSGASPVVRASYNVSSVTRNTTGDYTINFTTAFSDANYVATFGANNDPVGVSGANYQVTVKKGTVPTTTSVNIVAGAPSNGVLYDSNYIYASFFR